MKKCYCFCDSSCIYTKLLNENSLSIDDINDLNQLANDLFVSYFDNHCFFKRQHPGDDLKMWQFD